MAVTENSVMMALSELRQLESERVEAQRRDEEERRRAEHARQQEAARAAAEAEAAEAAERARERARIEAEARLRIEAEVARDRSLEALRAQLDAVKAEREAVRAELEARVVRASEPASRRGPWALAFGLSSVVAAGLAGLLAVQSGAQQVQLPASAAIVEPSRDAVPPSVASSTGQGTAPAPDRGVAPALAEEAADDTEELVTTASRTAGRRARRPRGREHVGVATPRHERGDLARDLGLDDDDDGEVLSDRFLREATRGE